MKQNPYKEESWDVNLKRKIDFICQQHKII